MCIRDRYKDGKIWTEAFCRALREYAEIYISAGKYYIDRSLTVPSDTRIVADEHAEIILIKGTKTLLLRNENVIDGSAFVSDVALAFIAFSAGEFFRFSSFKGKGRQLVVITVCEALAASLAVFVLLYFILRLGIVFSLVLSALASATAPASTLMTIRQTKAKGDFVDTLVSVVALDDVVSLLAFSIAISVAMATMAGGVEVGAVILPFIYNILMVLLGGVAGYVLKLLMTKRSKDNRLIVSIALLFGVCGVGAALGVSPLLACMAMGTVYILSLIHI